jgi:AcrR family transcriptional regulator
VKHMITPKNDPRVIRTRQLLQNAFLSLNLEKDFKKITVRDITERATVNRATFYAHFTDKYELLDSTISDSFRENLLRKLNCDDVFNRASISDLLIFMCGFHNDLSNLCQSRHQSLASVIESKIIEELQNVIFQLLLNGNQPTRPSKQDDKEMFKTISIMLSWSIYGAAFTWNKDGQLIPVEQLVSKALPLFMNGIEQYFTEESELVKIG